MTDLDRAFCLLLSACALGAALSGHVAGSWTAFASCLRFNLLLAALVLALTVWQFFSWGVL